MVAEGVIKMTRLTIITIRYHWFPILLLIIPDFLIKGLLRKAIAKNNPPVVIEASAPKETHPVEYIRELPRGLLADVKLKGTWSFVLRRL